MGVRTGAGINMDLRSGLQLLYTLLIGLCLLKCVSAEMTISISKSGDYDIMVNQQMWLTNSHAFFQVQGHKYSTLFGDLKLLNVTSAEGVDVLGKWTSTVFWYMAGNVHIMAAIREYAQHPLVVFEQYFPDGAEGTAMDSPEYTLSAFPTFKIGAQQCELGYLCYGGMMLGDTMKYAGMWKNDTTQIRDGIANGPLALFDKKGNVMIISAFNQFMAASNWHDTIFGGDLNYGIMGMVKNVPKGFVLKTGVFYGSNGLNKAFEGWGTTLRTMYNKKLDYMKSDLIVNYLGYWTDNGAYYYYLTEKNKTYEDTMLDVVAYAKDVGIPYRYIQYDSWWYSKGIFDGVLTWNEAMESIFPHGLKYLYNKTGLPVIAHNRWWSSKTPYAKQNGGKFNFEVELLKSIPNDQAFWDWLLERTSKWGLITYEQDWLDAQFLGVNALLSDISLGRTWLMQMGKAARKHGMTIQYCMSNSRHGMQSLEIPSVTQVRVSDDYSPGQNNWKIGVTSIFAYALGLAPYKDSFWTTVNQPGNPYGREEYYPGLNAVASVLSSGLVGPADAIGRTNVSLLMRCCNTDGLILKPSKPVTAVDAQLIQMAFGDGSGPVGQVWTTYSEVSGLFFGTILAAQLSMPYAVTPSLAGFTQFPTSRIYRDSPNQPMKAAMFDDQNPLVLRGCTLKDFCLYHITPVLSLRGQEILLYGEISKWVPMSYKRIRDITISTDDVKLTLQGGAGEKLIFWVSLKSQPISISCNMSSSGTATLSVATQNCQPL